MVRNVPVNFVLPKSKSGSHDQAAELHQIVSGLDLEGKARLPLGHAVVLGHGPERGVTSPKSANGRSANTLEVVVDKGKNGLNALLEVGEEVAASVGEDITNNLNGDLLLHGDSSDGTKVVPVILIIIVVNIDGGVIISTSANISNLDLLASNGDLLAKKLSSLLTKGNTIFALVLLKTLDQALDNTSKVRSELVVVNLGHGAPKDVAGLAESGMVEVESLLRGLHKRGDVRLESLSADGRGNLAERVADNTTELELIVRVLDRDELAEGLHSALEEGHESLLAGRSNGTSGTDGRDLDLDFGVLEQRAKSGNELTNVLGGVFLVETLDHRVDSHAALLDDGEVLITGRAVQLLHSQVEVLDKSGDQAGVLLAHLLGEIVGESGDTIESGRTDTDLGVLEQVEHHGENLSELSADEVGGTLNTHAESENTSTTVVGVGVLDEGTNGAEKWNGDLAGRKVLGEDVEQAQGGAGRGDVLVLGRQLTKLGDDLKRGGGELLTDAETLNLELAVSDSLHEERQSLGTRVVVDFGVGRKLHHELHEVAEVGVEESRLVAEQLVEDLESLHGAVLLTVVNSLLQNADHVRDGVLEGLERLRVLVGVQNHTDLRKSEHCVDSDLSVLGVLDGLCEELEHSAHVLLEHVGHGLEECVDDVDTDFAVAGGLGGRGSLEEVGEVLPLAVCKVDLGDRGNNAGLGVAGKRLLLTESGLQELFADLGLLVVGKVEPMSLDELAGLDSGQLAEVGALVRDQDVKQRGERSGRRVVVLVQGGSCRLDTLGVGWYNPLVSKTSGSSLWTTYAASDSRGVQQTVAHPF